MSPGKTEVKKGILLFSHYMYIDLEAQWFDGKLECSTSDVLRHFAVSLSMTFYYIYLEAQWFNGKLECST